MLRTLKGDKKIETLFEKGFVLREKNILLKGYNFEEDESFFGVSVSKRFFKSAVDRNRIKRMLRESIRQNEKSLNIKKGIGFFVVYNKSSLITFNEVNQSVKKLLLMISE